MRAWLIGEEGKGIKEISAILNTTRLWTALGAVGGWARGLAISRAYSAVRMVKGLPLLQNRQHIRWMADETVKYRAAAHFGFLGAALSGIAEQGSEAVRTTQAANFLPTSQRDAEILLRVLTPVMKARCSLASVDGLREQMESLGGVGYCENKEDGGILNIARLYRDTNVNPMWEGTVSVMAEDFIRAVKGKEQARYLTVLDGLIVNMFRFASNRFSDYTGRIALLWTNLRHDLEHSSSEELLYYGRSILIQIEGIVCAGLLMSDASADNDGVASQVAIRWTGQ